MSRDRLAPPSLAGVSDRFGTPVTAITLTGAVLLVLIAFVPILEIAKLASAFQILVFALVNAAVVAFREGSAEYEPEFSSPLYPWMQAFGVVTGILLLTQMGGVALAGAGLITLGSLVWYLVYVRSRVRREGAARDVIRRRVGRDLLAATESVTDVASREVLVAITRDLDEARERSLISMAADLVRPHDGRVVAIRFEEVPDQAPLEDAASVQSDADLAFEARADDLEEEFGVPIEAGEIVSHDTKHAIVNFAEHRDVDTILAEHERLRLRSRLLGDPIDWVVRHAPCDVLLVDNHGYDSPEHVAIADDSGPYPPLAVSVAEAIASANDGSVTLWYRDDAGATDEQKRTMADYKADLAELISVPVRAERIRTDGGRVRPPDLLVRRGEDHRLRTALVDARSAVPSFDCTTITVYPHETRRPTLPRRLVERAVF